MVTRRHTGARRETAPTRSFRWSTPRVPSRPFQNIIMYFFQKIYNKWFEYNLKKDYFSKCKNINYFCLKWIINENDELLVQSARRVLWTSIMSLKWCQITEFCYNFVQYLSRLQSPPKTWSWLKVVASITIFINDKRSADGFWKYRYICVQVYHFETSHLNGHMCTLMC